MPYQYDVSSSQKIYLDNSGNLTLITLISSGPGQQQQAGTQLPTGPWTELPQVARVGGGVLVRCVAAQGTFIWQIQQGQIGTANATAWPAERAVPMPVANSTPTMEPMEPMKPMQMGDMQMSANPMTMRMGNMTLGMGNASASGAGDRSGANSGADSLKKFCTQCGAAVGPSDRYCGSCGHQLP